MAYEKQEWMDLPSQQTPITAARLNHLETQYDEAVASSVKSVATPNILYGNGASGGITLPFSTSPTGNTIVRRTAAGQVGVPGLPVADGDAASKAYVDAKTAGQQGMQRADMVSKLRYPVHIAHRGGAAVYPEHSWEAYRAAYASGFSPEADVRALADGTLVCIHDSTTTRTMNLSKNVASVTREEWRSAKILAPNITGRVVSSGFGTPVFFEDYLDEFGGKCVLWPEIKVTGAAADAAINAIVQRGLQKCVVVQSFQQSVVAAAAAAGCYALMLTTLLTPSEIQELGATFVGVDATADTGYISSLKAAGLRVVGYIYSTYAESSARIAEGCDGIFSDDPWESSRGFVQQQRVDLSSGFITPGTSHSRASGGTPGTSQLVAIENEALRFSSSETSNLANSIKLGILGYGTPVAKIRFWAQSDSPSSSPDPGNAWLVGVYLGKQAGDVAINEAAGESMFRLALIRRNGQKVAYNKPSNSAATTNLGSNTASTPYAPTGGRGEPHLFEITFTATSIRIANLSRNDTDLVVSHAAWSGTGYYLSICVSGSVGSVWGITAVRP